MKRRFGISLPSDMVEKIDKLASILMIDRSKVIEQMLADSIEDRTHLLNPHRCKGVLIVTSSGENTYIVSEVFESYGEYVKTRTHYHSGDICIDIGIVEAESKDILSMKRDFRRLKDVKERYLPFQCVR